MNKILKLFIILLIITGCSQVNTTQKGRIKELKTGSLTIKAGNDNNIKNNALLIGELSSAVVTVSGHDMTDIEKKAVISNGSGSITINNIPIGSNRIVTVSAENSSGSKVNGAVIRAVTDIDNGENSVIVNWNTTHIGNIYNELLNEGYNIQTIKESSRTSFHTYMDGLKTEAGHALLIDYAALSDKIKTDGIDDLEDYANYKFDTAIGSFNISGFTADGWTAQITDPLSVIKTGIISGENTITGIAPGEWKLIVKDHSGELVYSGNYVSIASGETKSFGTISDSFNITSISPANGSSGISVDNLEIRIVFNDSIDTSIKGKVSFGYSKAPYLKADGFIDAAKYNAYKLKYSLNKIYPYVEFDESEISFETTSIANDTIVIKPDEVMAKSTYARIVVNGFKSLTGSDMARYESEDYSFETASVTLTSNVNDWRERVIYFTLTDRFNDGDSSNNKFITTGNSDYVLTDGKTYQGGDFKGLIDKMDYLKNLGITALWITSPVMQAWENDAAASYHGYWAQNFTKVDPHLGDMNLMREMVKAAHDRGIAVIMDVVVNHTGSLFYYPSQSNEWEPVFNSSGSYNAVWLEDVEAFNFAKRANRVRPMPIEFQAWDWFHRKGGEATKIDAGTLQPWGEKFAGDFAGLRDVATTNNDVRTKMSAIFKWWIANTNIDGFRIDTVGHVETEFWNTFTSEIRNWASSSAGGNKEFYMVAEVYNGSLDTLAEFTGTNLLDSVLGFNTIGVSFNWNDQVNSGNRNNVFRDDGTWANRTKTIQLENILNSITSHTRFNTVPTHAGKLTAADGITALTPRQTVGYFIDNHDLYRFLQDNSKAANAAPSPGEITSMQLALSWLLTWEGLPIIYYGTEQNYKQTLMMADGGEHGNGLGNVNKGNRPNLWQISHSSQGNQPFNETNGTFKLISELSRLRKTYHELGRGYSKVVWSDQNGEGNDAGLIAYIRHYGTPAVDDDILVVINTHPTHYKAGSGALGNDMKVGLIGAGEWGWPVGTTLVPITFDSLESSTVLNSTLYDYTENPAAPVLLSGNKVTTFSQVYEAKTYSAVYFMVPPNSITILKVQ